ncbi:hypothetical protein [Lysobacter sp. Root494]|uniref:hypothetical protein n=1 Tax=Lysobacter sp. Root494 TaxID=1736549 RepID=UPI0006F873DF|nr:hypothetical protein [Lysobacter sp. Root494]KQY51817.1 hypothetical protein ASD14_03820 [Lysobacter sp. Root494]
MRNLFAAVYFLLALFGCESGGTTMITHSISNGVDLLHAKTRIKAGVARFECFASVSGECHYTLLPAKCASTHAPCIEKPIDRFTMKTGESREVVGLPQFSACVSQDVSMGSCATLAH